MSSNYDKIIKVSELHGCYLFNETGVPLMLETGEQIHDVEFKIYNQITN
jgi:hypothetical protein